MELPKKEREYQDRFYMFVAKIFVMLDLKKKEIIKFKKDFEVCVDKVKEAYKEKDYDKARNIMAEFLLILHGKREGLYGFIQYPTKQKVKEE